jgi:hypothetical protein
LVVSELRRPAATWVCRGFPLNPIAVHGVHPRKCRKTCSAGVSMSTTGSGGLLRVRTEARPRQIRVVSN